MPSASWGKPHSVKLLVALLVAVTNVISYQNCSDGGFSSIENASLTLPGSSSLNPVCINGSTESGYPMSSVLYPLTCGTQKTKTCTNGQWDQMTTLYPNCLQQCSHPVTKQAVDAGSIHYSFSIASATTQAECNAAQVVSTCDQTTGTFLPAPAANAACRVQGQTCAYPPGTGAASPTGNSSGSTVTGFAFSSATYPTLCGTQVTRTCQTSGEWTASVPVYTSCTQKCLHPDTNQPVDQNSIFTYYTRASGTQAECDAAKTTSTCSASTGVFSPAVAAQRYASCSVQTGGGSDGSSPLILYTDITSGPTSGGENNQGIYLSIFGKGFGTTGLGTTVKVYINNTEVNNYRYLGPSRGRTDIQQITVQIGGLGGTVSNGTAYPIKVVVSDKTANDPNRLTFTPLPGNIYFVAPTGSDSAACSFSAPCQTVQKLAGASLSFSITTVSTTGVYGLLRAGDFIVMRGGTYSGTGGFGGYFMQALNKSGCPIGTKCAQGGGTSSGPIAVIGYPTENANINVPYTGGTTNGGAFSSSDSARQAAGYGAYWTFSNLIVNSGLADGPFNTQRGDFNPLGSYWRVVNNEMTAPTCANQSLCRAGGVAGDGNGNFWVGNYVHDIYDKSDGATDLENHGFYIGNEGSYEIAFNRIENIYGGSGTQTNNNGSPAISNVHFHHNIVNKVGKHCLNINDAINGIVIHNNVFMHCALSGLRFNSDTISGAKVFNNTFYQTDTLNSFSTVRAALQNDGNGHSIEIRNNIFYLGNAKRVFLGGNTGFPSEVASNNLFSLGSGPTLGSALQTTDPQFTNITAGSEDLRLKMGSPAIDNGSGAVSSAVSVDYDYSTRPKGANYDIGAFEY